jgi:hypothetical protein
MISLKMFGDMASRIVTAGLLNAQKAGRQAATTGDLLIGFTQFPNCEAAEFLGRFGIDRMSRDVIEAHIFLSDESALRYHALSSELAEVLRVAGMMPGRFGDPHTTDLQLLMALFCTIHPEVKYSISTSTINPRAVRDALEAIGVDVEAFKVQLLQLLTVNKRIRQLTDE